MCFVTGLVQWRFVIFIFQIRYLPLVFIFLIVYLTWCLSCHQNLLSVYPPSHVLLVLEHLARREQTELEEKAAQLDVTQEMSSLRYFHQFHLLYFSTVPRTSDYYCVKSEV